MNILLTLAFNGEHYHGFQVQKNAPTVCEAVQDAMEALLGTRPNVKGCSRTDAGVHALAYRLSFFAETAIPMEKLPLALNFHLPDDIRVLSAQPVPNDFHARYSATGKEYEYRIQNSGVDDVFRRGLVHRVPGPLDEAAMNEAAAHLAGTHDFSSFCSAGAKPGCPVRTLTRLCVRREGELVTITAAANGFLYNMVRILAGTLLLCGQGRLSPANVHEILAARNRQAAGPTLPACGLFLSRVFYPGLP